MIKPLKFSNIQRGGLVPYYVNDKGVIRMLFMVPVKDGFGGTKPQIAKGRRDDGESITQSSVREGMEELGIHRQNLDEPVFSCKVRTRGENALYDLFVFVAKILHPNDLHIPCKETKEVVWLTLDEFLDHGRDCHKSIVTKAHNTIMFETLPCPVADKCKKMAVGQCTKCNYRASRLVHNRLDIDKTK